MKTIAAVLLILFIAVVVRAQSTLYLSNLGASTLSFVGVASDQWVAQPFETGTNANGYSLDSIQLLMTFGISGSPDGFSVSLYNNNGNLPGSALVSLSGPSSPSGTGTYTYSTPGIVLSPSSTYWIVATAATPNAIGYYLWDDNYGGDHYTASDGWSAPYNFALGPNWRSFGNNFQEFAVYATPTPEPESYAIVILGLAATFLQRKK
ncbi:MAG: choice-of-anchor R domain-containing protein [Verrucomicrobiota bacterium]|jgi:hypothetical protein